MMVFEAGGYPLEEEELKKRIKEEEDRRESPIEIKKEAGVPSAYEFERLKLAKKRLVLGEKFFKEKKELKETKAAEVEKAREMESVEHEYERRGKMARLEAELAASERRKGMEIAEARAERRAKWLKFAPGEAVASKLATEKLRQARMERSVQAERILAMQRARQRQEVMPTAMQVIGKTPFEAQAQERTHPQGRDYAQFTQGVGMDVPSAAGEVGGVGERLGALLVPRISPSLVGGEEREGIGSRFAGIMMLSVGRDYGGMFLPRAARPVKGVVGGRKVGNRFSRLLAPKKRKFGW